MKIILLGLLLFIFYNTGSSQPIFIPFKGERQIIKSKDFNKNLIEGKLDITKYGKPCGDYFLYEEIKDYDGYIEHVVSLKVPVTDHEYYTGTNDFIRIDRRAVVIKFDNEIKTPTAMWAFNEKGGRYINLRISKKDFEEAHCLSKLK